jgi:hypothetical protein
LVTIAAIASASHFMLAAGKKFRHLLPRDEAAR